MLQPKKIAGWLLAAFILGFPFQIRTLVEGGTLYPHGNFNPYTAFFVYIQDLLLIGCFVAWAISQYYEKKEKKISYGDKGLLLLLIALLGILLINTFFTEAPRIHFFALFRYGELLLMYFLIVNNVLPRKTILLLLLGSLSFQALTAILQYTLQQSVGLRMLGEPIADATTPGIAKIDVLGSKIVRAFGTFPHANVLGGAMGVGLLLTFANFRKNWWILTPLSILLGLGLIFSFSRSAALGLLACALAIIALSEKKISWRPIVLIFSIALFLIVTLRLEDVLIQRFLFADTQSNAERMHYIEISQKMLVDKPWGVGLGSYTGVMQQYSNLKLAPWLQQPVHNIFILLFNEGGVVAGALFIVIFLYLFYRLLPLTKNHQMASICMGLLIYAITIGLFDHYFISLYPGQVLLFMIFALAGTFIADLRKENSGSPAEKRRSP